MTTSLDLASSLQGWGLASARLEGAKTVNLNTDHYNHCAPRVRQGETRQGKGYKPTGLRAPHDQPNTPKKAD